MEVLIIEMIEPSLVLYGFGTLFGILAILYFAKDVLLSLSVSVKLLIMYSFCLATFLLGISAENSGLSATLLVIGGGGYATSSFYFIKWYNFQKMGRFIIFAVSSVIFIGFGSLFTRGAFEDIGLQFLRVIIVTQAFGILVSSIIDWRGPKIEYRVSPRETISDNGEIGKIRIRNESRMFRRQFTVPSVEVTVEIEDIELMAPVKLQKNRQNMSSQTIGSGQEREIEIQIIEEAVYSELGEKDVSVPTDFQVSVASRDTDDFTSQIDDPVKLKLQ